MHRSVGRAATLALIVCACRAPVIHTEEPVAPADDVVLTLVQGVCDDSASIGQLVGAQVAVPSSGPGSIPGGLFATLALKKVDPDDGTFHFDVVQLLALSHSMSLSAPATARSSDVEQVSRGSSGGRVCVREGATVYAAIRDDIARFRSAWLQASQPASGRIL